jgi:hypothetical protein
MNYYNLQTFNDSHFFVKAEEVFGYGEYVESWNIGNDYIILYSYSRFYIEIQYNNEDQHVTNIKAISIEEAIEKYVSLDEVELEVKNIYVR